MGPRGLQALEAGRDPQLNRCPLSAAAGSWRRGDSLPLLGAWHTPDIALGSLVRLTAFTESPPLWFWSRGRPGWNPSSSYEIGTYLPSR